MTPPLLLRGARQLLTLRDAEEPRRGARMQELGIVPDGSLLAINGLIEEVGSTRRVVNLSKARGAAVMDASGCVVLPGFVDALVDIPMTGQAAPFLEHGTTALRCRNAPGKVLRYLKKLPWLDVAEARAEVAGLDILSPLGAASVAVRERIDAGEAIALATAFDGCGVRTHNMQAAIALACLYMGLTAAEAITAATINAAHAIGLAGVIGSLDPGKQADVIVLQAPDYRQIPYHFGENLVRAVIKKGRVVYQRGERTWDGV
ncbi:MAG TPA: amidohydrolase family protein [Bryobacteraceae bacterium]|nr:amidohydrolase family protein [Bryobacteraceae bacterium]